MEAVASAVAGAQGFILFPFQNQVGLGAGSVLVDLGRGPPATGARGTTSWAGAVVVGGLSLSFDSARLPGRWASCSHTCEPSHLAPVLEAQSRVVDGGGAGPGVGSVVSCWAGQRRGPSVSREVGSVYSCLHEQPVPRGH